MTVHTKAEGSIEYTTLFYIPKKAPMDMFRVDYQTGLRLYVKRVFINDDDKELMPTYLRFLRGIIDVEDLPLNVSREILQQNKILANVKQASTKKILSELEKLAKKDSEKYNEFYEQYGRVLKEGVYADFTNKDQILELIRFKSSTREGLVSLAQYKEAMKEDQKAIFTITGQNEKVLRNSPLLEQYTAQGIEVLILDDEIDEIVFSGVTSYKETPWEAVGRKSKDEDNTVDEAIQTKLSPVIDVIKSVLGDALKDVTPSKRLTSSPVCLVEDEDALSPQMKAMFKQMGGGMDLPDSKPIMEINPNHEMIEKLMSVSDKSKQEDLVKYLYDQAMLMGGKEVDMVEFTARLNRLVMAGL
jgi:molecular chaperone HtpG